MSPERRQNVADRAPQAQSGPPPRRLGRLAIVVVALTAAGVLAYLMIGPLRLGSTPTRLESLHQPTYRAFEVNSWWNTPLPDKVPVDPHAGAILHYLRTAPQSGRGCLTLAGAGDNPWGNPIYWAKPGDPTYDVTGLVLDRPAELSDLRIPRLAQPAPNSDSTMSIYDLQRGYVAALSGAHYDASNDSWTARGATITYLDSNGLNVKTGQSDNPHNVGSHRGNNGATMTASWDQVNAGALRHVLKIAAGPELSERYVFPMVGSDGGYAGNRPGVPPEGLRLRLKPTVDLAALHLKRQALVIATALQRYGMYLGDSGGTTALKLENTRLEGRGQLWNIPSDALCVLPFTPRYWEVVAGGYYPGH
jgi:hypothetical protein